MFGTRKGKLAYHILMIYLANHILLACSILIIAGRGIRLIENRFYEKYINYTEESVEALDVEILQLKTILSHAMLDEHVLMLREGCKYLSSYQKVNYKLKIKSNLAAIADQYRFIHDIGIYIPEEAVWIEAQDWFIDKPEPAVRVPGTRLDIRRYMPDYRCNK